LILDDFKPLPAPRRVRSPFGNQEDRSSDLAESIPTNITDDNQEEVLTRENDGSSSTKPNEEKKDVNVTNDHPSASFDDSKIDIQVTKTVGSTGEKKEDEKSNPCLIQVTNSVGSTGEKKEDPCLKADESKQPDVKIEDKVNTKKQGSIKTKGKKLKAADVLASVFRKDNEKNSAAVPAVDTADGDHPIKGKYLPASVV